MTWPPPAGLTALRQTGPDTFAYGRPGPIGYREEWRPVREHLRVEVCSEPTCWRRIAPFSPGTRAGERGTQAYFEPTLGLWRHRECHERRQATNGEMAP